MSPPRALVFDLYGTLLRIDRPVFQREVSRLAPTARRAWVGFERDTLVVTPYASHEEFVRTILERFRPEASPAFFERALDLLREELESIQLLPSVLPLLGFLKRRGLRIGVLSNAASPYREPLARLGVVELCDAVAYSCDERERKPEPRLFATICDRLGVAPAEAVMIGDSMVNDVLAAKAAGLAAILVGTSQRVPSVPAVADLGWWHLEGDGSSGPLLRPGDAISLAGRRGEIQTLEPLAAEQGRYNLVARGRVRFPAGVETVYVKRFLHPASAYLEAFVHELLPEFGVAACPIEVREGSEPLLLSAEARGVKLHDVKAQIDAALAFEIGRHFACGYLIANADLRPRNAFLERTAEGPKLVMLDHEYCLLNRSLDLDGIADPFDRQALEALGGEELEARTARQVLTPQTMRRARRQFFDLRPDAAPLADAFRAGWVEVHRTAQGNAIVIRDRIAERLNQKPPLVAGTQAYRRALTRLDLDDMMARIALDPVAACAPCL